MRKIDGDSRHAIQCRNNDCEGYFKKKDHPLWCNFKKSNCEGQKSLDNPPHRPWFWQHGEVHAGILIGQLPALQVAEVLEHVLREERSEGGHHGGHQEHHRAQGLHGVQALVCT